MGLARLAVDVGSSTTEVGQAKVEQKRGWDAFLRRLALSLAKGVLEGGMADFVCVGPDGSSFTLAGRPFYFCGTNCYYLLVSSFRCPRRSLYGRSLRGRSSHA
jgi:hypothetical protein